jgi:hypothetical protein
MEFKFSFFDNNWISCDFLKGAGTKPPWALVDWGYKHPQNHPKYVVVIQDEWWLLDLTLVLNGDISGALGFLLAGVYGSVVCTGVVYLNPYTVYQEQLLLFSVKTISF